MNDPAPSPLKPSLFAPDEVPTSGLQAAVIGASGAIGQAWIQQLIQDEQISTIWAGSRSGAAPVHPKVRALKLDLTDEASIAEAATQIEGPLHCVIITTGILHQDPNVQPERSLKEVDPHALEQVFRINTIGPLLILKHLVPLMPRQGRSLIAALSARIGSISDNRLGGWYAYRASKAALNMLIRTASIELRRRSKQAVVVGLHPGTVDSSLSQPFQAMIPPNTLFTPTFSAAQQYQVLAGLTPDDSGHCFAWDGQRIEP